jgi:predicted nucleotide-binding protein
MTDEDLSHSRLSADQRDSRKVFVVHGRDLSSRDALFDFLRSLGLQPIEWSEALRSTKIGSPSILGAVNAGMDLPQVIIVLLTPDDKGGTKARYQWSDPLDERMFAGQPRLNVIFEAGRALALLPNDTVFVRRGRIRKFTDIDGLFVYTLGPSVQWRAELRQFLIAHGCDVDHNSTGWLEAGDFGDLASKRYTEYLKRWANFEELLEIEELDEVRGKVDRSKGKVTAFCLASALQHNHDVQYWLGEILDEKSAVEVLFQFIYSCPVGHDRPAYRAARAIESMNQQAKNVVSDLIRKARSVSEIPSKTDEIFQAIDDDRKVVDVVRDTEFLGDDVKASLFVELQEFPATRQLFI